MLGRCNHKSLMSLDLETVKKKKAEEGKERMKEGLGDSRVGTID